MRKQMIINGGLLLLLLLAFTLPAAAQQPSAQVTHYYKNGLAFDYPASMQIEDLSKEDGQQLVLTTGKQGAQIMVISRFDKINSAQELAAAATAWATIRSSLKVE